MLFNLLKWLDASPAHYWTVAWAAFGCVVALALLAVFFPRERAWWQHPVLFSVAMLMVLLAFRWPVLLDNRQYPDPDESQMIAGASTLRHDPVFWRSVDGLTHGPLDQWPLLLALFARGRLDFTTARSVSTLLLWISLVSVWLVFRHLYQASVAGLLVLPLLAVQATRDGNCSYQIELHQQRNYYRQRFLHDFLATQPPVFVDAVGLGNFVYEDRAASAQETFPELREYITDNYRLVRDIEGTRILCAQ